MPDSFKDTRVCLYCLPFSLDRRAADCGHQEPILRKRSFEGPSQGVIKELLAIPGFHPLCLRNHTMDGAVATTRHQGRLEHQKPVCSSGKLAATAPHLRGVTKNHFGEGHCALSRRFQKNDVTEPSDGPTRGDSKGQRTLYEEHTTGAYTLSLSQASPPAGSAAPPADRILPT
jgi:hypothetical protein